MTILPSIVVNALVNVKSPSTGTLYVAPANGYAIIQLFTDGGATVAVNQVDFVMTANTTITGIYVGPGGNVTTIALTGNVSISGVEFVNSA